MNNNDEISPVRGLPDYPPEGEHILWQGAPHQGAFIERVFHLRLLAAYFAVMVAIFAIMDLAAGVDAATVAGDAAALIPVALVPLVLLWLVGRWMAKTTVYTITNKRVVLDFGLALTMAVNVPFERIFAADLKLHGGGIGDLPLRLTAGKGRVNYAVLWPHARPWKLITAQPSLRCIEDAEAVAAILAKAWTNATAGRPTPAATADEPLSTGTLEPAHR